MLSGCCKPFVMVVNLPCAFVAEGGWGTGTVRNLMALYNDGLEEYGGSLTK